MSVCFVKSSSEIYPLLSTLYPNLFHVFINFNVSFNCSSILFYIHGELELLLMKLRLLWFEYYERNAHLLTRFSDGCFVFNYDVTVRKKNLLRPVVTYTKKGELFMFMIMMSKLLDWSKFFHLGKITSTLCRNNILLFSRPFYVQCI